MRVSFEWLKDFVKIDASAEAVAEKLTMTGLEVEAIERFGEDVVLEINVTPNRPDCLSMIGIARELSASYGIPLTFPDLNVVADSKALDFNVEIAEPELCSRYAGRIVRSIRVGPSPEWMRNRLEKCGIRSINNIVDVTNYVLLEFGHPLHAFDLNTLKGNMIRIGTSRTINGKPGEKITSLDGVEREVPGDALLIWDGERPVAIAGVMGGRDTEVTEGTTDIFIESAYFDPSSIRRTGKALGLKTEASYRFERGTDIKALKKALDRAAILMREVAGGTVCGKLDIYPKRYYPKEITVRFDRVNKVLGLKLSGPEILRTLTGLGLEISENSGKGSAGFKVKIPPFRRDITMEADIIEEVARLYGFDNIPTELPKASLAVDIRKENISARETRREIREAFLKSGYSEAINLSFMGTQDLDLLRIPDGDARRNLVRIKNPLREEESFMRTTLVPSLLRNLVYNLSHGNRELRLFETAKTFIGIEPGSLPEEKDHLAAICYREKTRALYKDETPDFYQLKGMLDALLDELGIRNCTYGRSGESFLHPGRSADIMIDGTKAGFIGALSPSVIEALDIKAQKPSVIILEIDLNNLIASAKREQVYRSLPKYPFVERDTAIVVDSGLEAAQVISYLKSYPSDLIEDISIFDVFQGGNIAEGKKSIAFSIRYRSTEKTLTDEEVESLHKSLVDYITEKTAGQLRI